METSHVSLAVAYRALFLLVLSIAVAGCGPHAPEAGDPSAEGSGSPPFAYPAELSPDSTPAEVVAVLVRGLDAKDGGLLAGLAAAEAEAEAIAEIVKGYRGESPLKRAATPAGAARLAAAGWLTS